MLEHHPDSIVPMLPNQLDIEKERNETRLEQIGEQLVSFLEQCFLSPSLKYDKMLSHFVTKGEPMSSFVDFFKEDERPRHIGQLKTADGQVQTQSC
jgi:hypothetical protein